MQRSIRKLNHPVRQPTHQQVREWLIQQIARHTPPPDIVQIRRALWGDIRAELQQKAT